MPSKPFQPGDRVVWWTQTPGGGDVSLVLSTVRAVTPKRPKIEDGKVNRNVLPSSMEHHASLRGQAANGDRRSRRGARIRCIALGQLRGLGQGVPGAEVGDQRGIESPRGRCHAVRRQIRCGWAGQVSRDGGLVGRWI